jgi:hypothetical protein
MFFAHTTIALAEGHIQNPVQLVLDAPMTWSGVQDDLRIYAETGALVASCSLGRSIDHLPIPLVLGSGAQARPVGVLAQVVQEAWFIDRPAAPLLHPVMDLLCCLVNIVAHIFEVSAPSKGERVLDLSE